MGYYSDTNYIILDVSELDKIIFEDINEDSKDTVVKSIDGTKTFINWTGSTTPSFINDLTTMSKIYTYEEFLDILNGPDWLYPLNL